MCNASEHIENKLNDAKWEGIPTFGGNINKYKEILLVIKELQNKYSLYTLILFLYFLK